MKTLIKIISIAFFAGTLIFSASSCSGDRATDESNENTDSRTEGSGNTSLPEPGKDPEHYFSALSGRWAVEASDWKYFDSASEEWRSGGSDPGYEGIIMGDAMNKMLFGFGFWDPSFGFLANISEKGSFTIPVDPAANPIARVSSGSGTYILYITMYDFDTKYSYGVGKDIPVEVAEDMKSFSVKAIETQVNSPDGPVNVKYSYLALIGKNIASGSLTMFSNWMFPLTPTFRILESVKDTRNRGFTYESYLKSRELWEYEIPGAATASESSAHKITETVSVDDITGIWLY